MLLASDRKGLRVKGSDRIQINNLLGAISFGAISFLIALSPNKTNPWLLGEMALSIPFLVTSSLAYSKIVYRPQRETRAWNRFGWVTHSIGYLLLLNSLTLMLRLTGSSLLVTVFLASTVLLFVFYSVLDVIINPPMLSEKVWKLLFYLLLILAGAVLPILTGVA